MLATVFVISASVFPLLSTGEEGIGADTLRHRFTLESLAEFDPDADAERLLEAWLAEDDSPVGSGPVERAARTEPGMRITFGLAADQGNRGEPSTGSPCRWWGRGEAVLASGIAVGGTIEKDGGERADLGFWSAVAEVPSLLPGIGLCLGDYRFEPGLGLLFGGDLQRSGAGWFSRQGGRVSVGLRPHRSRNEVDFHRGFYLTLKPGEGSPVTAALFLSGRRLFGRGSEEGFIIDPSGTFQSEGDLLRRSWTRERMGGVRVVLSPGGGLGLGCSVVAAECGDDLGLRRFALPPSSRFLYLHGEAQIRYQGGAFAWEVLRGGRGGWGTELEWRSDAGEGWFRLRAEYRSRRFMVHRGGGSTSGDLVLASMLTLPVSRTSAVTCALQQRRQHLPRAGEYGRPGGTTALCAYSWEAGQGREIALECSRSWREEERLLSGGPGGERRGLVPHERRSVRIRLVVPFGRRLAWRLNALLVGYREGGEEGFRSGTGFRQDLLWEPLPWCSIGAGTTLVRGESYGARLYFLEPDPIRGSSLIGAYGEGEGCSLRVQFHHRRIDAGFYASVRRQLTDPWGIPAEDRMLGFRFALSR